MAANAQSDLDQRIDTHQRLGGNLKHLPRAPGTSTEEKRDFRRWSRAIVDPLIQVALCVAAIPIASRKRRYPIQHVSLVFHDVSRCAGILSKLANCLTGFVRRRFFHCPRLVPDLHSAACANLFDQELSMNRSCVDFLLPLPFEPSRRSRRIFSG